MLLSLHPSGSDVHSGNCIYRPLQCLCQAIREGFLEMTADLGPIGVRDGQRNREQV